MWDFAYVMLCFRATKTLLDEEIKVHIIWHFNHVLKSMCSVFLSHHSTDDNIKLHNSLFKCCQVLFCRGLIVPGTVAEWQKHAQSWSLWSLRSIKYTSATNFMIKCRWLTNLILQQLQREMTGNICTKSCWHLRPWYSTAYLFIWMKTITNQEEADNI